MEKVGHFIGWAFFVIFIVSFCMACIVLRPFYYLFDRRRYRYPKYLYDDPELPLGFWRFACIGLKENSRCPNCGIKKQELIR
jgi:hypothetical protein